MSLINIIEPGCRKFEVGSRFKKQGGNKINRLAVHLKKREMYSNTPSSAAIRD